MTDINHDDARSVSAEQFGWTHRVEVYWWEKVGADIGDRHRIVLTIAEAEHLHEHLGSAIRQARDRQLDDARRGPCHTCKGTRMISKEVHGRVVHHHSHCPDCPPADIWEGPSPR